MGIAGFEDQPFATEQSQKFFGLKIVSASSKVNWQKCLISLEQNYLYWLIFHDLPGGKESGMGLDFLAHSVRFNDW